MEKKDKGQESMNELINHVWFGAWAPCSGDILEVQTEKCEDWKKEGGNSIRCPRCYSAAAAVTTSSDCRNGLTWSEQFVSGR